MTIDWDKIDENKREKMKEFMDIHDGFTTGHFLIYYFVRAYLTTAERYWLAGNYVEKTSKIYKQQIRRLKEYSVVRDIEIYKDWVLEILRKVGNELNDFKEEIIKDLK